MLSKPITTADLFNKICDILKQKNLIPDILDYSLSNKYHAVEIKDYEFDFDLTLNYGSNEGIYLKCGIHGLIGEEEEEEEYKIYRLGTFKTLRKDKEAMYIMAKLYADFIIEGSQFVNDNLDDFTWVGADVTAYDKEGQQGSAYSCRTKENAEKIAKELLKKYPKVVLRDNETREERVYVQ